MHLGIIADDLTGATDVAGFLVAGGVPTVQLVGVPPSDLRVEAGAAVISLKSRSCPPIRAVEDSLAALDWLLAGGCRRFYQKYCSTFDSTPRGNIGPVADALMEALDVRATVVCPALPVNGRTIYNGYLFVNGVLLQESGMRHHPINPMTDSHLVRLMEVQAAGRGGVVTADLVDRGPAAVRSRFEALAAEDVRYVVLDTLRTEHLDVHGEAFRDLPLVTGGSGLAASLAKELTVERLSPEVAASAGRPGGGDAVVLSGSCSETTRAQVAAYASRAPAARIEAERCMDGSAYAAELADWVEGARAAGRPAPLVYATTDPESLANIRARFGGRAGEAIEATFAELARRLGEAGTRRFIVAGGETSGAVVQALGIRGFHVGPQIAPGVPWVRAIEKPYSMALKSGNFGMERFFFECQDDVA